MQAKQLDDHELVGICITAVCEKAGFADPSTLVQRDLQNLADAIEARTGVLMSISTIKRLLNGQFSRLPQIATLNALAQFLDYPHWQAFRVAQRPIPTPIITKTRPRRIYAAIGLLLVTTLALLAVKLVHRPTLANLNKAQFSATKVTGNDIPNSVVFHYNVDDVVADSFFIQQSWDKSRRVRVFKKNYTLTDIYYEPGFHKAKLFANDSIIKTFDVSIPTDRWIFYAKEQLFKGHTAYITPTSPDIPKYNAFIWVDFPSRIQYSSDDFVLHYRFKVKNVNNANCPYLMTEIFCEQNFMFYQTWLKVCTSEAVAQFAGTYLSGKTHDLSGLGADIASWQQLTLTVKDHRATIAINGVPTWSTPYVSSGGRITGLGFMSNGFSTVDSVDFRTGDGTPIITDHPPSALSSTPPDHPAAP